MLEIFENCWPETHKSTKESVYPVLSLKRYTHSCLKALKEAQTDTSNQISMIRQVPPVTPTRERQED